MFYRSCDCNLDTRQGREGERGWGLEEDDGECQSQGQNGKQRDQW